LSPAPHKYLGRLRIVGSANLSEHTYLLFSHVSHLEPTFHIAPEQSPWSESVSLIEIGPMSGEKLMGILRAIYDNSKHLQMKELLFMGGLKSAEFEVEEEEERWRQICIDGDIITVGRGTSINLRMCKGIEIGQECIELCF
jgi:hypothetical protein